MTRSRYDSIASQIVKKTIQHWKVDFNKKLEYSHYSTNINTPFIKFDLDARLVFTDEVGLEVLDSTGADGRVFDDEDCFQTPFIDIDIAINPEWLPEYWSRLYMLLCDIVRHEIEHITQEGAEIGNYKHGKPIEDDSIERGLVNVGLLSTQMYLMLPKEVDANLQGLRFEAKKRKEPIINTIYRYLGTQSIDADEKDSVLTLWRNRAKKIGGIPNF
jgi:hypothetical protein